MNENSLIAYYKGTFTGRFSKKRFNVLKFIQNNPNFTRQEISKQMTDLYGDGYEINAICGRVAELKDANLITEIPRHPRSLLVSNFESESVA